MSYVQIQCPVFAKPITMKSQGITTIALKVEDLVKVKTAPVRAVVFLLVPLEKGDDPVVQYLY